MTTNEWLTFGAVLLSPLIAVQVSVLIQHRKEKRDQRLAVFRTLMATRAANLTPAHVEALNMIDVAFYGSDRKSKAVVEACKVYLEHHNSSAMNESWGTRRHDPLIDLLQKMAGSLGYEFDKVSIARTSYFPRGFGNMEWEHQQIRQLLLAILKGERVLPVWVAPPGGPGDAAATLTESASAPVQQALSPGGPATATPLRPPSN